MRNKILGFNIDLLKICYETENSNLLDYLATLDIGERIEFYEFYLLRIEGKYYDYVFQILYEEFGEDKLFGELRYGLNSNDEDANIHINGKRKAWIYVNNRVLYKEEEFHYLSYISDVLGLDFHNITSLDLCLDMTMNIARYLKRLIRCKDLNVILNGKRIRDRKEDRPEIIFTMSGDLDRDKYLTVNIKQKKAIKDKSRGCSLIAYNKKAEIANSSDKQYITELYDNPKKIHRLEVHLNNVDLKYYLNKTRTEFNIGTVFNEKVLFSIFYDTLERLIRFERNGKKIEWWDTLEGNVAGL